MEATEPAREATYLEGHDKEWDICTLVAMEDGAGELDLRLFVRKPQISTGFVTRLFNYGSMYHLLSNDLVALQSSLERAVMEDPDDKESWSNLGCLLFQVVGHYAQAVRCLDRAVRVDRSVRVQRMLARAMNGIDCLCAEVLVVRKK